MIVQSNKVQTCYTRYASIYKFFFLERKEKNNRGIVMKYNELYKVERKHTGLVCFVVYSQLSCQIEKKINKQNYF